MFNIVIEGYYSIVVFSLLLFFKFLFMSDKFYEKKLLLQKQKWEF